MHEASIAQSIIETVLAEAKKQNAKAVDSVEIEIGELTFLGTDQIQFWLEMGFKSTLAENAEIRFIPVDGVIHCQSCGFEGHIEKKEDPAYHMTTPVFSCSKCGSASTEITRGKEAIIRRIHIRR